MTGGPPAPARRRPARSAARSARRGASPRQRELSEARSDPSLVIAGDPEVGGKVASSLSELRLVLRTAASVKEALDELDDGSVGVVLVSPLPDLDAAAAIRKLRRSARSRKLPLFVVLPDDAGPVRARRLYAAGATAVLEWPREGLLLPRVVLELLAVTPRPRAPRRIDRALARAARARLRLAEGSGSEVHVEAWNGVLQLSGRVDSLRRKQEIERFAVHVPGARGVIARDLVVRPSGQSDARVAERVGELLRETELGDTLSVSVSDGHVVLMGTVGDRAALVDVLTLLASVRGVRAITPLARESSAERRRDHRVARQLQRAIARGHPGASVRVAVLGGAVVLSGCVRKLATRRAIEGLVRMEAPGLERLVDKLEVTDGATESA